MMDDKQVLQAIRTQYPDMAIAEDASPYRTFGSISDYAIGLAGTDKETQLAGILTLIGQQYAQGTGIVKNCIDNAFLFRFLRTASCSANRKSLLAMIPQTLRPALLQHMNAMAI